MRIHKPGKNDRHIFGRPAGLVAVIFYETISGVLEMMTGLLILLGAYFWTRTGLSEAYLSFVARELLDDPQDVLLNWLTSLQSHVSLRASLGVGAAILFLGLVKLAIAAGMWFKSWAVRNVAIVFFGTIALLGVYGLASRFSLWKAAAFVADVLILYYFWRVLPRHLQE